MNKKELLEQGYQIENAYIDYVSLTTENLSSLVLNIGVSTDKGGGIFGNYKLGSGGVNCSPEDIEGSREGLEAILHIMNVVGVECLEDLKGKNIRIADKGWGSSIYAIGNIIKDKWFSYDEFFSKGVD